MQLFSNIRKKPETIPKVKISRPHDVFPIPFSSLYSLTYEIIWSVDYVAHAATGNEVPDHNAFYEAAHSSAD